MGLTPAFGHSVSVRLIVTSSISSSLSAADFEDFIILFHEAMVKAAAIVCER